MPFPNGASHSAPYLHAGVSLYLPIFQKRVAHP